MKSKLRRIEAEEQARELRFSELVYSFASVAHALSGTFAHAGADTLLAFLADPERRRTLRRRAYGFGFVIDDQEGAAVGFAKLRPIFDLLAATAAEDGDDPDLRLSDLSSMTKANPLNRSSR